MRYLYFTAMVVMSLSLSACGGGTITPHPKDGGGSSSSSSSGSSPSQGSSGSSTSSASSSSSGGTTTGGTSSGTGTLVNVAPLVVDGGPAGLSYHDVDVPFTTITLCDSAVPAHCQTIDHILVDTGSTGLRIMDSVLSPTLQLTNATDASARDIGECTMFVSGYIWGPVKLASLRIGGEETGSMPVQIIGDSSFASVPSPCSNAGGGQPMNSVNAFGANGLIGIGNFKQDCGSGCANNASNDMYYACSNNSCSSISVSLSQQLPNPVSRFAVDNNGVILKLPAVAKSGATSVSGSLIFGINTQANNNLNGATILTLDPRTGFLATVFDNTTLCDSFIDSGSNGLYFPVSASLAGTLPFCSSGSSFYCPASTQDFKAQLGGLNGATASVDFSVANLNSLSASYSVFNDIAGGNTYGNFSYSGCSGTSQGFDWGLPFFLGKSVYVAFEKESVGGSTGPFVAF